MARSETAGSAVKPEPVGGNHGSPAPPGIVEIQRARILAAMSRVSAERGVGQVTVAEVIERAGVSRRTFYELYDGREDCFLAAFDRALASARRRVLDSDDPEAPWLARIRAGVLAALSFLEAEPDSAHLLIVSSLGGDARVLERRRRAIAQLSVAVDAGRQETKRANEALPLTAEAVVGGVLSVLNTRLTEGDREPARSERDGADAREPSSLASLAGSLVATIAMPYLGAGVARRELARPTPTSAPQSPQAALADPLRETKMRLTYRTVRVLCTIANRPGCSNREIATLAEIGDQGQISKLLTRLARLGLIENAGSGQPRGGSNAWMLTPSGEAIERRVAHGALSAQ